MQKREQELRRLVTDYHHATGQTQKIHADAQARAAKIAADAQARADAVRERADKEASAFEEAAHSALRAILELGETRESTADLTGLSTVQIRAIQRAAATTTGTSQRAATEKTHPTDDGHHASSAREAP